MQCGLALCGICAARHSRDLFRVLDQFVRRQVRIPPHHRFQPHDLGLSQSSRHGEAHRIVLVRRRLCQEPLHFRRPDPLLPCRAGCSAPCRSIAIPAPRFSRVARIGAGRRLALAGRDCSALICPMRAIYSGSTPPAASRADMAASSVACPCADGASPCAGSPSGTCNPPRTTYGPVSRPGDGPATSPSSACRDVPAPGCTRHWAPPSPSRCLTKPAPIAVKIGDRTRLRPAHRLHQPRSAFGDGFNVVTDSPDSYTYRN